MTPTQELAATGVTYVNSTRITIQQSTDRTFHIETTIDGKRELAGYGYKTIPEAQEAAQEHIAAAAADKNVRKEFAAKCTLDDYQPKDGPPQFTCGVTTNGFQGFSLPAMSAAELRILADTINAAI